MEYNNLLPWFIGYGVVSIFSSIGITFLVVRSITHDRYRKKLRS